MNELSGEKAELKFTIDIKRAATGETETFELVGTINQPEQEQENVSNT